MPASSSSSIGRDASLTPRANDGAVLLPDGRRVAAWPQVFLRTLHANLAAAPEAGRQTLYRAGFEWGLQEFVQLSRRLRTDSGAAAGVDIWQMDPAVVFDRWSAPLATAGWGTWTIDRTTHAGLAVVELRRSAVVAALAAAATEPACHLYAGLFAGALSFYQRAEAHACETSCAALGAETCKFIVGPAAAITQAETARRGGATHDAILRTLATPPAPPAPPEPAKAARIPWGKK